MPLTPLVAFSLALSACGVSNDGLTATAVVISNPAERVRAQARPIVCPDCGIDERPMNRTCRAVPPPPELAEAVLAFPALGAATEPVMVLHNPTRREILLVERRGLVSRFDDRPDAVELTPVLDIEPEVDLQGDAGLVAAALDPAFDRNGRLFLSYSAYGGPIVRSRVSRFESRDGGASFEPASQRILIDIDQEDPWRVHLGADMKFGPDGFLYLGFGDGGPWGDPYGHAQSLDDLRGKILRIDVRPEEGYRIPPDNPFLEAGGRPEIFARGLRNPWRFSFDPETGALWVGDVGFVSWEEINRLRGGENLGWPFSEGNLCLAAGGCPDDLTPPHAVYDHELDASVVGGFVYRGRAIGELRGRYVFGDYMRGDVWALTAEGQPELIARTGLRIVSFAEEPNGELLIVDFGSGRLFRLEPQVPHIETLAPTLAATGCFRADDPRQPAEGLVSFDVRLPFWSDGAVKRRFLALPDGQSAQIRPDGAIVLPVGSVLAKQFFLDDRLIETRLMMKYREGRWTGASYVWDGDGRDARLVGDGEALTVAYPGVDWRYPDRPTCLGCHNSDRALAMEVDQLDLYRTFSETGRLADQLETFRRIGLFEGDVPPVPRLPRAEEEAGLEQRARAYLHVNCAICHTRSGPTPVDMDLRFDADLADMRVCDVLPREGDLGIRDARRLTPGAPERSLLYQRMRAAGPEHMPPIGPQLVDEEGAAVVNAWIQSLRSCP